MRPNNVTLVKPDGTEVILKPGVPLTNSMLTAPLKIKEPDFQFEGIAECGGFDADGNPLPPPSAPPGTQMKNGRWVWDPPLSAVAVVNKGTDCSECSQEVYQPVCATNAQGTQGTAFSACMANCVGAVKWTMGACKNEPIPSLPGDLAYDVEHGLPDSRFNDPKWGKNTPPPM